MRKQITLSRLSTSSLVPLWIIAGANIYELYIAGAALDVLVESPFKPPQYWKIWFPVILVIFGLAMSNLSNLWTKADDLANATASEYETRPVKPLGAETEDENRRREIMAQAKREYDEAHGISDENEAEQ